MVLVLDNEGDIRDRVRTSLEPEGYRVVTVADRSKALAFAQRNTPDVLILDLEMDGKTGIKVLRHDKDFFELVVGSSPMAIVVHDAIGNIMR